MEEKINQIKEKLSQRTDLGFIKRLKKEYPKAKLYLVGGAVRDFLLGKKLTDLDFLVENISKTELEKFLGSVGSVKNIESRTFGVFVFKPKGGKESFDFSLPRSDKWTGQGYKDLEVDVGVSVEEDLKRRDFTVNALALNLFDYQLIDPFNGRQDLENKVIRTVGLAQDRFKEDPSRILRGVRFSCQLGFEIEKKTQSAMEKMANEIVKKLPDGRKRVAEEVIAEEFLKSFDKNTVQTVNYYDQFGLLKILLPEVEAMKGVEQPGQYHSEGDVYVHNLLALEILEEIKKDSKKIKIQELVKAGMLDEDYSIELKLGLLFHDIGKPATFTPPSEEKPRITFNEHDDLGAEMAKKIIKRLKLTVFPKKSRLHVDPEKVEWLVRKHMVLVGAKPEEMRLSTLERYFFNPDGRGKMIMTLSYCDITATVPPSGKPDYELLELFLDQIEKVREEVKQKQVEDQLPTPLLDGHDIIKALKIKPGPKVGKIKDQLRDLELAGEIENKKQAIAWLKKQKK